MGLPQVRYSRSYLKLPAARPFCSRLCRVGAAIVTHPPAPQEHSSPVHPHRETRGEGLQTSLRCPGSMLLVEPGWETGLDPEQGLASPRAPYLHPRKRELNIGHPSTQWPQV